VSCSRWWVLELIAMLLALGFTVVVLKAMSDADPV
jgi:hypothetical protein